MTQEHTEAGAPTKIPHQVALPPDEAFTEIPGLRGIRVATIGRGGGRTLELIEAAKGVVIPARTNPGREQGRVLTGRLRFFRGDEPVILGPGDRWDIPGGQSQGPHVVLDDGTWALLLRDGEGLLGAA